MDKKTIEKLIDTALAQLDFSYAPYSGFNVGAALLAKKSGSLHRLQYRKCSYTPTNCAERTAFFKAVSEGVRDFEAICIVGGKNQKATGYTAPCGVCRQVMMEFCNPKTFKIILAIDRENYRVYTLEDMLPQGFGPANLE